MSLQSDVASSALAVACLLVLGFLTTGPISAQPPPKAAGELASASQATINGAPAISGMTVFNNNRVSTTQQGIAIVNLGRLGRVELGAETDLTLRFSTGQLGGELRSGRLVVSAPAGVVVSVSTARGTVVTDGRQAATLTIEVDSRRARVLAHRGGVGVVSGTQVERVEEGEEIALDPGVGNWKHRRLATANSERTGTFAGLINAGINHSMARLAGGQGRDADQSFSTTITCRDRYHNRCRRRGAVSP